MATIRTLPLLALLIPAPAFSQALTFPEGWDPPRLVDGDGSRTLSSVRETLPSGFVRTTYYQWRADGPPITTISWINYIGEEYFPTAMSEDGETILFNYQDLSPSASARVHQVATSTTSSLLASGLNSADSMSYDGLHFFGSFYTFGGSGTEPTTGVRWDLSPNPTTFCSITPSLPCNFLPRSVSADGQVIAGVFVGDFHVPEPEVYRWTAQGPLELVAANGTVSGISANGETIVGLLPNGDVYRWTELGGLVNIGAPNAAPSDGGVHLDGSGDVVMGFFPAHVWRAGAGWSRLDTELVARGMTGFSLTGTFAAIVRELSSDGNAILVHAKEGGQGYDAMLYLDGRVPGALGTNYCGPGVTTSTGSPAYVLANGSTQVAQGDLTIRAAELPRNTFGFLLNSRGVDFVPGSGGSVGSLCLGGASTIGRHVGPGEVQSSGADGVISVAIDLTQLPTAAGPLAVAAGDVFQFQMWFRDRDAQGMATSNFTDAVSVEFF